MVMIIVGRLIRFVFDGDINRATVTEFVLAVALFYSE
jgi:hypothetical protein